MTMAGSLVRVVMVLTINSGAVCFDAYHALTVKGTPCAFTLSASNGEVPAANDAGRLESVASALNFLGVTRVELKLAKAAICLAELDRDDAAASALNETLDECSLVGSDESAHGKKKRRGSRLVE
jgi:hypothetical protein